MSPAKSIASVAVGLIVLARWIPGSIGSPACSSPTNAAEQGATNSTKQPTGPWDAAIAAWKQMRPAEHADNSDCRECHLNLQNESLVKEHRPHGVGCETCHGLSEKHRLDQEKLTPPDVMFTKTRILEFCTTCHEPDGLMEETSHVNLFTGKNPDQKTCTHCHGKVHRLQTRSRRWDKETGKLLWDNGGLGADAKRSSRDTASG